MYLPTLPETKSCVASRARLIARTGVRILFGVFVFIFGAVAPVSAQSHQSDKSYEVKRNVYVPMRDGVRLATDLYFPLPDKGNNPIILIRTPYGKSNIGADIKETQIRDFTQAGYVVAIQDFRGLFESEGVYKVASGDRTDSYDTIEWLSRQSWSSGRIGTLGCSAVGQVQISAAAMRHPAHRAAVLSGHGGVSRVGDRYIRGAAYENGVLELAQNFGWLESIVDSQSSASSSTSKEDVARKVARKVDVLPLLDLESVDRGSSYFQLWSDYALNNPASEVWATRDHVTDDDKFNTPTLHIGAWYDSNSDGTVQGYHLMKSRSTTQISRDNQHLIMHPGVHCAHQSAFKNPLIVGARDMGDARLPFKQVTRQWFDHWLKGKGELDDLPKVQAYEMGTNQWRTYREWPPANIRTRSYFLHSKEGANSLYGDGKLSMTAPRRSRRDEFVYNPLAPAPTIGGAISYDGGGDASGPFDQRSVEVRNDVLVYTSEPLESALRIAGPPKVVLHVGSSAVDTDFTAKLVDVLPDGTALNISETIIRMRWRNGLDQSDMMTPNEVYEVELPLPSTHIALLPGHKLRLEVSSSSFPRFLRNLNTGGDNVTESETVVATNRVYHSRSMPSRIELPILP
ncbi:MAG: CocE/NonD family hydrolase [Pseudomonadota bacterium]